MKQTVSKKFYTIEHDGVTQGLLQQFLDCREKARLFLQGYSLKEVNLGLTFGTIIHAALNTVYAEIQQKRLKAIPTPEQIKQHITQAEKAWHKEHTTATPIALQRLELSILMAEAVLPIYFHYWKDDFKINWTGLEQQFACPYVLPDGRKTILRGKRDGDFLDKKLLWLLETKTKSHIEEEDLVDRLPFDLQNNFYLYDLRRSKKQLPAGILYNIIRRPQLRQGKDESLETFAKRCAEDVASRPEWYFLRLEIAVTEQELNRWEGELEDLVKDFYDWFEGKSGHYRNPGQCETKYGRCEFLHICAAKRMSHYFKRAVVFRELEDY